MAAVALRAGRGKSGCKPVIDRATMGRIKIMQMPRVCKRYANAVLSNVAAASHRLKMTTFLMVWVAVSVVLSLVVGSALHDGDE